MTKMFLAFCSFFIQTFFLDTLLPSNLASLGDWGGGIKEANNYHFFMGGGSFGYLFTLVFGLEMHKNKKIPCAPIKISKKKKMTMMNKELTLSTNLDKANVS